MFWQYLGTHLLLEQFVVKRFFYLFPFSSHLRILRKELGKGFVFSGRFLIDAEATSRPTDEKPTWCR